MTPQSVGNIVEATLLAAGEPLGIERLLSVFSEEDQINVRDVEHAISSLTEEYRQRGIELVEVASGFRLQIKQTMAPWIARLWEERPSRLSRATLETLALITYRQPITRGEIEEVRGVSVSSSIIKSLQERGWVRVLGHKEVPGRPALLGTTSQFLDYFNLKSLSQLPSLSELRNLETIQLELDIDL